MIQSSGSLTAPRRPYDPKDGKPKKRLHGYLIFVKECKQGLVKDLPNLSWKDQMNHIVRVWKGLPRQLRIFFEQLENNDKKRYEDE